MRRDPREETLVRVIRHAKFAAGIFNQARELWVMNVRDLWKQMVLDLKIQTAEIPGQQPVVAREINGGLDLVNSPVVLHLARLIWKRELSFFDNVGQLKDHADQKPVHPECAQIEQ